MKGIAAAFLVAYCVRTALGQAAEDVLIQYQPIIVVCSGSTVTYTSTRTITSTQDTRVTVLSTASTTRLTTVPPGPSGGPSTVITFVTQSTPGFARVAIFSPPPTVTVPSTASTTGLTTVPPGPNGGPSTVITYVKSSAITSSTPPPPPPDVIVTRTIAGTLAGTTTIRPPAGCTRPCTTSVIIMQCVLRAFSATLSANQNVGSSTQVVVPACATRMSFSVLGGSGGQLGRSGGYGAMYSGNVAVSPGTQVRLIAGGSGTDAGVPGISAYGGNGGRAYNGGGGGGGASALYLGGRLLSVAGGGGGGSIITSSIGKPATIGQSDSNTGKAGQKGVSRIITTPDGKGVYATSNGGNPGTASGPGAGGVWSGYSDASRNGNRGNGANGADGAPAVNANPGGASGSGAGGGGVYGGGSGSTGYWNYQGTLQIEPAGGGGGSSYIDSGVSDQYQSWTNGPGRVIVTFA